ncbi:hypothetical protein M422DRAFT_259230 [Sphaerobolus stellatus SS14]|uniref:F-box domain-containing protein n=1 Tax=Sphaerobolus stellatus (strain SS14) TaxID=990650 RepID=A0A0C9V946_SPHS4|nr:hypothetical protein M422DRAFT_259230 [Sphaerobolus stellatus SS14]
MRNSHETTNLIQSLLRHGDAVHDHDEGSIYSEHRLPAELLGEIFKFAVALCAPGSPMTVNSAPLVFTRVSRLWRSIAFSYSSLWEHLAIGPTSTFHVYEVIAMFLRHCSPNRPLTITAFPPLPNWHNTNMDVQIFSHVSSLQSNAVNILGNLGITLPTLDTLDVNISDASYTALEGLLQCCSMLKNLTIKVTSAEAFNPDENWNGATLDHLTRLELKLVSRFDPGDLITLLYAPHLRDVKVTIIDDEGGSRELWLGLIYLFIISSEVETVTWKNIIFPASRESCFLITALHTLKRLKNIFIQNGNIGHFFNMLSRKHSEAEWLCPALTYINFLNVPVIENELVDFLYARKAYPQDLASITTLILRWCRGISENTLTTLDATREIQHLEVFDVFEDIEDFGEFEEVIPEDLEEDIEDFEGVITDTFEDVESFEEAVPDAIP